MEWVETTAKTVELAKELALDQLGVDEADAEFEIVDEPRPGLFGRMRGEARVRARIKPSRPRPKVERRDRRRKDRDGKDERSDAQPARPAEQERKRQMSDEPAAPPPPVADPAASAAPVDDPSATESRNKARPSAEEVADEATRFIDGLLAAFDLEGSTTVTIDGDELDVQVDGPNLGVLIGPRGTTLLAVQDIVRVASQRRLGDHATRLRVDISGYRQKRRDALSRFAVQQADAVAASGSPRALEPMPSADRKVIHDSLIGRSDVTTRSEGEEPRRRVVIVPAGG
jgi:spoIIIJ-associated protein